MFFLNVSTETCYVSGVLNIVLRVSQVFGIAPVSFQRKNGIWCVSVTPMICIINYVFTTIVIAGALAGLIFELVARDNESIRTRTATRCVVWISDFSIVLLNASLAGYNGPSRLQTTINCLSRIQKLNVLPPEESRRSRKASIAITMYLVFIFSLLLEDHRAFLNEAMINNRSVTVVCCYICYYLAYIMLILMDMQYIFSALEISRSMKYVNNLLEELLQLLKIQNAPYKNEKVLNHYKVLPIKSINLTIDSLAAKPFDNGFAVLPTSQSIKDSTSRLAEKYSLICDIVRVMDRNHGLEILALLLSFLLHLVITPYNLIINLYAYKSNNVEVPVVIMQVLWCGLHFSCTAAIVEPAHQTQYEVNRTSAIVSRMIIECSDDALSTELKKFSNRILLNKVNYSPLGVCTLSRSVVASMVGSVATYLVIILQFQESEH